MNGRGTGGDAIGGPALLGTAGHLAVDFGGDDGDLSLAEYAANLGETMLTGVDAADPSRPTLGDIVASCAWKNFD